MGRLEEREQKKVDEIRKLRDRDVAAQLKALEEAADIDSKETKAIFADALADIEDYRGEFDPLAAQHTALLAEMLTMKADYLRKMGELGELASQLSSLWGRAQGAFQVIQKYKGQTVPPPLYFENEMANNQHREESAFIDGRMCNRAFTGRQWG